MGRAPGSSSRCSDPRRASAEKGDLRLVVTDASALVEYLLRTPRAERIRTTVEARDTALHTIALCGIEIASALRRAVSGGRMSEERARQALDDYCDLPIIRHEHEPQLGRIFDLRHNFSAYDAAYAVLAEAIDAELLTADRPFAKAVRVHLGIRTLPE